MTVHTETISRSYGTAFISNGDDGNESYWYEGDAAILEVQRTDMDEIRVGICGIPDQVGDSASFYLNRENAIGVLLALAQAIGTR